MSRKKRQEEKEHSTQVRKSKSDMKYLRIGALIGLFLFVFILIAVVLSATVFPHILVSPDYNKKITPFALVMALYIGASFIFRVFFDPKTSENRINNSKIRNFILVVIAIVVSWLTYTGIVLSAATFFHQLAPKEPIEVEVMVTSAWPSHGGFRSDCQYHAMFDSPKISSSVQSVCLNDFNQWIYFRDVDKPVRVTLYGEKSYFGYELVCCKK